MITTSPLYARAIRLLEGGINIYLYAGANPVMWLILLAWYRVRTREQRRDSYAANSIYWCGGCLRCSCGSLPASMGGASGGVHCEVVATCTGDWRNGFIFGIGVAVAPGFGNVWFGGRDAAEVPGTEPRSATPSIDIAQYTASCGSDGDSWVRGLTVFQEDAGGKHAASALRDPTRTPTHTLTFC